MWAACMWAISGRMKPPSYDRRARRRSEAARAETAHAGRPLRPHGAADADRLRGPCGPRWPGLPRSFFFPIRAGGATLGGVPGPALIGRHQGRALMRITGIIRKKPRFFRIMVPGYTSEENQGPPPSRTQPRRGRLVLFCYIMIGLVQ